MFPVSEKIKQADAIVVADKVHQPAFIYERTGF